MNNMSTTLCWDCAKAIGKCSWSDNLIPIEGWIAKPVKKECIDSYLVIECPLFERDAYNSGQNKFPREERIISL